MHGDTPNLQQLLKSCLYLCHFVLIDLGPLSVWTGLSPMELKKFCNLFLKFQNGGTIESTFLFVHMICTAFFIFLSSSILANVKGLTFAPGNVGWCLSCEVYQMSKSNFKNYLNDILFHRLIKCDEYIDVWIIQANFDSSI